MIKILVLLVVVILASAQTNPKSFFAIKNVGESKNSSFQLERILKKWKFLR
jgi:hypothetical protein